MSAKEILNIKEGDIISSFAKYFGIDRGVLISPTRKQEIVKARDLTAYLLREHSDLSFPAIGRLLGGRDHSTIIHAYQKIKKLVSKDKEIEKNLEELIGQAKVLKERKAEMTEILSSFSRNVMPRIQRPQVISERDLRILELYRQGLTLESISKQCALTRERVRQIVKKTIQQMAINESFSRGITLDADILIEEERKRRLQVKEDKKPKPPVKIQEKRWSRYFLACKSCGTTAIPHIRQGLCQKCAGQFMAGLRDEIISRHSGNCDSCGISRKEAAKKYGRDLYIMKDQTVLCRGCFLNKTGAKLRSFKAGRPRSLRA